MSLQRWRANDQSLFILNRHPYRETSLLIDGLTPDYGKVALIAKGARGAKSRRASILQPFIPLRVSWQGRTELMTLTQVERDASAMPTLSGKRLYCGFYLNEIIVYLLHAYDPHPQLFEDYRCALMKLAEDDQDMAHTLRQFECGLLQEIGYQLILDRDVQTGLPIDSATIYGYLPGAGPSVDFVAEPTAHQIDGKSLLTLKSGDAGEAKQGLAIKRLMRFLIDHQLNGKMIKSRSLFS